MNIIALLNSNYQLEIDIHCAVVEELPQYPHIRIVKKNNSAFVFKQVKKNVLGIDNLFGLLSGTNKILVPMQTKEGHFYVEEEGHFYLLYRKLENTVVNPSAEWWAECLCKLHTLQTERVLSKLVRIDTTDEVKQLFIRSKSNMDTAISEQLTWMLDSCSDFSKLFCDANTVLSHGDSSHWNVLQDGGSYKLIDAENCFFSYKEFDIQHLLWNQLALYKTYEEWELFWLLFRRRYEALLKKPINYGVLAFLYRLDYVKTISWLYLVSHDNARADMHRQKEELVIHNRTIMAGMHKRVLQALDNYNGS